MFWYQWKGLIIAGLVVIGGGLFLGWLNHTLTEGAKIKVSRETLKTQKAQLDRDQETGERQRIKRAEHTAKTAQAKQQAAANYDENEPGDPYITEILDRLF